MDERMLRAQMKSKLASGEQLSGKDRARRLKYLREQEKAQNSGQASGDEMAGVEENRKEEGIRADSGQVQGDDISDFSLPAGFFDNEKDEMVAKGVNISEEMKKRQGSEEEVLQSFFDEVDNINPDEVNVSSDDREEQEDFVEDAVQLAYSAKVGNLMLRYDPTSKKGSNDLQHFEEAAREASEIISQDHEVPSSTIGDNQDVIQRIVGSSMAKKKRKLDMEDCEYVDLMDWTSKSIC